MGPTPFTSAAAIRSPPWRTLPAIPAIFLSRAIYAFGGGLMSYGTNLSGIFAKSAALMSARPQGRQSRRTARHTARQIRLDINLKTAKALGLEVPTTLLALADEVIE